MSCHMVNTNVPHPTKKWVSRSAMSTSLWYFWVSTSGKWLNFCLSENSLLCFLSRRILLLAIDFHLSRCPLSAPWGHPPLPGSLSHVVAGLHSVTALGKLKAQAFNTVPRHLMTLQLMRKPLKEYNQTESIRASLVVQGLRLQVPNAGGPGLIPGQGTRSHLLQPRLPMTQLKIPYAVIKTWQNQK